MSVSYEGQSGKGLESSRYGQQALALDWTGTLAIKARPASGHSL